MTNEFMNGQEEIDLLKLLKELWKRAWIIVAAAIVGGTLFFLFTLFFVTPQYTSYALLYVNNNSVNIGSTKLNISSADLYASNSLVDTFSVILKSRNTLEEAIAEGAIPYTYEQLSMKVTGGAEGSTPIFKITVTDPDPTMAAMITNQIVEVIIDKISEIVAGSSVKVVDYAVVPKSASSPNYTKNTAIGMLIGFVIASGIIILRSLMDSTIREEEFLLDKYKDIPLLSTIPDLREDSHGGYYGYGRSYAKASEKARKSSSNTGASVSTGNTAKSGNTGKQRPGAAPEDNPFVKSGNESEV